MLDEPVAEDRPDLVEDAGDDRVELVGAVVEGEAVALEARAEAADHGRALHHRDRPSPAREVIRGGEAGHSSAQDDHVPRHQCGNGRKETASVAMSRSGCAAMKLPMVTTTARATDVPRASSRGGEPPAGATLTAGWKYIARTTPR